MPSDLNQKLYLGALLDGLKFTITKVVPSVPDRTGWHAGFNNPSAGSIASNKEGDHNHLRCPFEVGSGGYIGVTKLTSDNGVWSKGIGGQVVFQFHLEGTSKINGTDTHVNNDGYIVVSASEWKGMERPDVSNITYYWPGNAPQNVSLSVPTTIAGMPDDIFFLHGAKPDEKELGMTSSTDKATIDTALDYAIKGIFWVNQKLFGWALGKFTPW